MLTTSILKNIRKIMNDKGLTQATMAEYANTSAPQFSKILNEKAVLSIDQLSNIASNLSMSEIDIITYPEKYVPLKSTSEEPIEAILQIRLKKDKKDQVLKLVFGDNNIEILNK